VISTSIATLPARLFAPEHQTWGVGDTQLYALGLGIGQDPCDAFQLRFVQAGEPLVLPTQAAVLAGSNNWMRDPANGIDFTKLVALSHRISVVRPLPASGKFRSQLQVTGVYDRGPGRGAVVDWRRDLASDEGQPLAVVTGRALARGNGGFGGPAPARDTVPKPVGQPSASLVWATHPGQALLYALSGDRNPLHTDPTSALSAGFRKPILHGLCSLGICAFAASKVLQSTSPSSHIGGVSGRYAGVVYPGESLRIDLWTPPGTQIRFRCVTVGRSSAPVIEDGIAWCLPGPDSV
jgi:acyl dehydratase